MEELLNITTLSPTTSLPISSSILTFYNSTFLGSILPCSTWQPPQHMLFQIANVFFLISYLSPSEGQGIIVLHGLLIIGFLLYSTWAWNVICAPDIFSWNFFFMLLNMGQLLYIVYQSRPVKFDVEVESVYQALFSPLNMNRIMFKKLLGPEYAQTYSLHAGEAYAMQALTRTDRLSLLLAGKASVFSDNHFLHHIHSQQFMDAPEFHASRARADDKFKVSIIATTSCRYLSWQRSTLEYLFIKEPFIATVLTTLIARDITTKLYAMNQKIYTDKGSHLDIRLPSMTSTLAANLSDSQWKMKQTASKTELSEVESIHSNNILKEEPEEEDAAPSPGGSNQEEDTSLVTEVEDKESTPEQNVSCEK